MKRFASSVATLATAVALCLGGCASQEKPVKDPGDKVDPDTQDLKADDGTDTPADDTADDGGGDEVTPPEDEDGDAPDEGGE